MFNLCLNIVMIIIRIREWSNNGVFGVTDIEMCAWYMYYVEAKMVADWMVNVAHSYPLGVQLFHYIPSERA
jgi:hypothetical protein